MSKSSISRLRQIGGQKKATKQVVPKDPLIEAEEKDIKRLERLLGITTSKNKKSVVDKLNKEYESEGIGADFGSFLMDLDGIIGIDGGASDDEEDDFDALNYPHESLASGKSKSKKRSRYDEDEGEVDEYGEPVNDNKKYSNQKEKSTSAQSGKKSKIDPEATITKSIDSAATVVPLGTYVPPSKRLLANSTLKNNSLNKDIPIIETKQEKAIKKLRRCINGTINKLTEETKDRILQEIKELYDVNDTQLITNLLLDCVFEHIMANHLKVSFQLPLFTTFLTAVHALIGESMARATVHKVFEQFLNIIEKNQDLDWNKQSHNVLLVLIYLTMLHVLQLSLVVDLVTFFLHPPDFIASIPTEFQSHRFFTLLKDLPEMLRIEYVDMMLCRVGDRIRKEDPNSLQSFVSYFAQQLALIKFPQGIRGNANSATAASDTNTKKFNVPSSNNGHNDPKNVPTSSSVSYSRRQFIYESLADFDCKRMQRVRDKHFAEIKECRKWLSGNVQRQFRSVMASSSFSRNKDNNSGTDSSHYVVPNSILAFITGNNDYTSHNARIFSSAKITVPEKVMNVATASALLHDSANHNNSDSDNEEDADGGLVVKKVKPTSTAVIVEQIVASKGQQLRLNTPIRKAIFSVLMTCRDVEDAYEKIMGLHLGATMDRDLVRVLLECTGKETPYNPFYAELLKVFCTTMPACKLTTEIAFYDEIATIITQDEELSDVFLSDSSDKKTRKMREKLENRVMNHARMLADLLMQFKLTLAVLRKIDMQLLMIRNSSDDNDDEDDDNDNDHQRKKRSNKSTTTMSHNSPLLVLFLSTLFMTMFTYTETSNNINLNSSNNSNSHSDKRKQEQETQLLNVCDRLGRSKHYETVRTFILFFLEHYMKKLPVSIPKDSEMGMQMKKGRTLMMKSMRDMEILHQYTTADTAPGYNNATATSTSAASKGKHSENDQLLQGEEKEGGEGGGFGSAADFDRIGTRHNNDKKKYGKKAGKKSGKRVQATGWDAAMDFD